jgi:ADP-heptose:LPS heptosyltransferase
MKILIIKLGALGDVINTLPLAVNIKKKIPCEIHWLVAPLSRPLLDNHPCIDQVFVFNKKQVFKSLYSVIPELRKHTYDVVLDLQRILKSGIFSCVVKSRRRIGFDKDRTKEFSWLFPFERLKPASQKQHMLDHYLDFLSPLNIERLEVTWQIPRFSSIDLPIPKKYIVLNIGATKPANRWAPENFAQLADIIHEKYKTPCLLTGGREDQAAADLVLATARSPVSDLTGKTSLEMLIEILAHADYVISCDTGPMHLARALGTEVIALFGPSDPIRTGPYQCRVIQKSNNCSYQIHDMHPIPCNSRNCSNPLCMKAIKPSDVIDKIEKADSK